MGGGTAVAGRVAEVTAAVRDLLCAPDLSLSQAQRMDLLRSTEELRRAAEALHLKSVRAVDAAVLASGARGTAGGGTSATVTDIRTALRIEGSQARRDVLAARATCPDTGHLPRMGAALAAGTVSRRHVDVAVAVGDHIPAEQLEARGGEVDAALVAQSEAFGPGEARVVGQRIAVALHAQARALEVEALREKATVAAEAGDLATAVLLREQAQALAEGEDPDRARRRERDERAEQRRGLTVARDYTGMLVATFGQWSGPDSYAIEAWLRIASAPEPARETVSEDGTLLVVTDDRTAAQRRADALALACRIALAKRTPRTATGPRASAHVLLTAVVDPATGVPGHVTVDAGGTTGPTGTLPGSAFRRLACNPVVQRLLLDPRGAVVDLGRSARLVTPAQWTALVARDRGCLACGAPVEACEAHHVLSWTDGGPSQLQNYALLCGRHHADVHTGRLRVVNHEGLPHVVHPVSTDPYQRPRRVIPRATAPPGEGPRPDDDQQLELPSTAPARAH